MHVPTYVLCKGHHTGIVLNDRERGSHWGQPPRVDVLFCHFSRWLFMGFEGGSAWAVCYV
jgi:hypothetical protein